MKQVIKTGLLVLLVSVSLFTLFGCQQGVGTELSGTSLGRSVGDSDAENDSDGRRRDLALLKSLDNHKATMDELEQMVLDAFSQTNTASTRTRRGVTRIESVKKVSVNNNYKFENNVNDTSARFVAQEYETAPIELFEFTIGANSSEKYVLASNDVRIGHIIAITDGSLDNTDNEFVKYFNASLQDYIDTTALVYNDITDEEVEAALEESATGQSVNARSATIGGNYDGNPSGWIYQSCSSDLQITKRPLLLTKWGQGTKGAYNPSGYAYNNYIKYIKGNTWVTGCATTAMAQIIAYHNYINPNADSRRLMPPPFNSSTLGTWTGTYNLSLIRSLPTITNSSPAEAKGQVAALMYHILVNAKGVQDKDDNTVITMQEMENTFRNLGYIINYTSHSATRVTGTNNNFSLQYDTDLAIIKGALNNNRPFILFGVTDPFYHPERKSFGHIWVVDGYGTMSYINEYYKKGNTTVTKRITVNGCLMVHCNMGSNHGNNNGYTLQNYNGWYVHGVFNTAPPSLQNTNITQGGDNYSTQTWILIPQRP